MEAEDNKTQSLSKNTNTSSLNINKLKKNFNIQQIKKGPMHYSYNYSHGQQMIVFKIPILIYSVRDAIEQAIQILNTNHNLNLSNEYIKYQLYAAKKSGKKKSDLPSFDYSQELQKTGIDNFCIQLKKGETNVDEQKNKLVVKNVQINNIISESKIIKQQEGQYGYYRKSIVKQKNKTIQIVAQESAGCFCFNKKK